VKIVFFDGHCNLCNGFVNFLIRRQKKHSLQVAPLQGTTAKEKLEASHLELNTIVYFDGEKSWQKSTAVLHILMELGSLWRTLAFAGQIFPRPLRDFIYDLVAKNRYRLFGRQDTCRLPTESEKERFLP
jgi:predicted DCC family thiol-disulfide oxidoreductase YuxK